MTMPPLLLYLMGLILEPQMSRSQLLSRDHIIVIDLLPLTRTKEMLRLQQWITEETRRAHHGDERFRGHGGIRLSGDLGIVD